MSIRPVDMQIVVQKTTEVSKNHHAENQRPEVMQHNVTEKIQKEAELNEQRVIQTDKTEQEMIDKDGRGGASREGKKRNRRDEENTDKDKASGGKTDGMFDFRI